MHALVHCLTKLKYSRISLKSDRVWWKNAGKYQFACSTHQGVQFTHYSLKCMTYTLFFCNYKDHFMYLLNQLIFATNIQPHDQKPKKYLLGIIFCISCRICSCIFLHSINGVFDGCSCSHYLHKGIRFDLKSTLTFKVFQKGPSGSFFYLPSSLHIDIFSKFRIYI